MADINSSLQIFAVISLVGIFVSFIIRVSIQALILRIFTKKYQLPQNYGKAWLTILIPSLVVSLLAIPLVLFGVPDFVLAIIWILFFPILIFSMKWIYKTDMKVSSSISIKYFLVILVLVIIASGLMTVLGGVSNPTKSDVPQSTCSMDCEFAVRTDMGVSFNSLTVKGYNIPSGKFQEKANYIISQQTFTDLNNMERGVNNKIVGKLNANNCNYMEFTKDTGGTEGESCKGSSKSFFTNFKNILIS